jgi:hypothetical protein
MENMERLINVEECSSYISLYETESSQFLESFYDSS